MIYCTLSTSGKYLLQGLTMYHSIRKFSKGKLYYLCLDEECYNIISKYKDIVAVKLEDLPKEDIEQLRSNPKSNYAPNEKIQFYWSLTSYFTWWMLQKEKEVMYVDADIFFLQNPENIKDACKGYGCGIHTHRFADEYKYLNDNVGEFNVGCVYFNQKGIKISEAWKNWLMYTDHEYFNEFSGCGDQKYLNLFPVLFKEDVKIIDDTIGYAGPWNYDAQEYGENTVTYRGATTPLVFIHFARFDPDFLNDRWKCNYQGENFTQKKAVLEYYNQYFEAMKKAKDNMHARLPRSKDIKICFAMIVYNSDYVLKQTLDSIYPYASQIVINHAPVANFRHEPDNTGNILSSYPDPENKITIINKPGQEKTDLCRAYMPFIKNDIEYLWTIDADEIFKPEHIERTIALLKEKKPDVVAFHMTTFVGGLEYYLTGYERNFNVRRLFRYEPGAAYIDHRPPTITTEKVDNPVIISGKEMYDNYGVEFYHYSYVFPRQVKEKVQYYEQNIIARGNCIPLFFENVWLPWAIGENRDAIEKQYQGIHEFQPTIRGECLPKKFIGKHPAVIERVKKAILLCLKAEIKKYRP